MELKQLFEAVGFSECLKDLQAIGDPISAGAGILPAEENSTMQTFHAKDADGYRALCQALEQVGFHADYQNQIGDNLFGEYSNGDQQIYLY